MTESNATTVGPPLGGSTRSRPKGKAFFRRLPGTLAYPLKGAGWAVVIAGAVVFWVVALIGSHSVFGFVGSVLVGGYLAAFMIKVIGSSAAGEEDLPDWPEFRTFWDDIVLPLLLVTGTCFVCLGPSLAYLACGAKEASPGINWQFWAILSFGLLYLPMGLLAVALFDSIAALNPLVVIAGIARTLPGYLVAAGFLYGVYLLNGQMQAWAGRIPYVGGLLTGCVSLYGLMVEMRILGLLYLQYARRLKWFD